MAKSVGTELDNQKRVRLREEAADIVAQRIVNGRKMTRKLYRAFSLSPLVISAFFLWVLAATEQAATFGTGIVLWVCALTPIPLALWLYSRARKF